MSPFSLPRTRLSLKYLPWHVILKSKGDHVGLRQVCLSSGSDRGAV